MKSKVFDILRVLQRSQNIQQRQKLYLLKR